MGDNTKIEWTRGADGSSGASWNPIIAINRETGKRGWFCVHQDDSCRFCYAERQNVTAHWLGNGLTYTAPNLAKVRIELEPHILEQPLHWTRPRNIFVCSMTDLFGDWVTDEMLAQVWSVCERAERHTKQILSKRSDRMLGWLVDGPTFKPRTDFWLGFSAGDQQNFNERWRHVRPLAEAGWVTWVSLEPMLGPVKLPTDFLRLAKWAVAGGESGPHARPSHPDWFRDVAQQCKTAGVAFFMKQITDKGRKIPYEEFPKDLRTREFPNAVQR